MNGRRLAAAGLLAAVGILAAATPAQAHAGLVSVSPAIGSVVAESPGEVVLRFSERVDLSLGAVSVVGPTGRIVSGRPTRLGPGGKDVAVKLRPSLPHGTYTLSYRVLSADGHPAAGGFSFSVGAPSATATAAAGTSRPQGAVRALLVAARTTGYVGLVVLIGPLLVLLGLWPRRLPVDPLRRLIWLGWGLIAGAAIVEVLLQAPYASGTGLAGLTPGHVGEVLGTRYGVAHAIRLGLLVAAAPLLAVLLRTRGPARAYRGAAVVLGTGLLLTWPWSGHGGTSTMPIVTMVSDCVHLAAMTVWLGGLFVLARYLLPAATSLELRLLLPEWSRWATTALVALVASGTVQALLEVGGGSGLLGTTYGRLVLAKIALLALMLRFAVAARGQVRRRYLLTVAHAATPEVLAGADGPPPDADADALATVRRGLLTEAAIGAVVLVVAAVLVQTAPGRTVTGGGSRPAATSPATSGAR